MSHETTSNTNYALTKRVKKSLVDLYNKGLLSQYNFDIIRGSLVTLDLEDDTNLYLTLKSLLSLGYYLYEVKSTYHSDKVFLTIKSKRRIHPIGEYEGFPLCSTNGHLSIKLDLNITNMSGNTTITSKFTINHELSDGTWINISPVVFDVENFNSDRGIMNEEEKALKLWKYAFELYQ